MPYIKQENRTELKELAANVVIELERLNQATPGYAGNMNFLISTIISSILTKNKSYATINEFVGMLECVKQELYRRIAFKYEDQKAAENGDVY